MAGDLKPIDISNTPDILRLAEEVRKRQAPYLLRRDSEDIAVLTPIKTATRKRTKRTPTAADIDAAWATFGLWQNEDVETFLRNNEESRRISSRLPVEL